MHRREWVTKIKQGEEEDKKREREWMKGESEGDLKKIKEGVESDGGWIGVWGCSVVRKVGECGGDDTDWLWSGSDLGWPVSGREVAGKHKALQICHMPPGSLENH